MKKIISFILCICLILPMFYSNSASALEITNEFETTTSVEYLENGDYIVTTIEQTNINTVNSTNSDTFYVQGTKNSTYYNENNEALWKISITATFECLPKDHCTLMSYSGSGTSYSSNWKVHDVTAYKKGQIAICEGQGTHYFTLIKMETINAYVDLRCNTYGTLV